MITRTLNQIIVKLGLAKSKCDLPKTVICEDFPLEFEKDTVYIRGYKKYLYTAAFMCPCNMSHKVFLNLQNDEHPCWSVIFHINGTVTLNPSIWHKNLCCKHFFIRKGKIIFV